MWPLTDETQKQLGQKLNSAIESGKDSIIALWDSQTCYFLACHVHAGVIVYTECCGPISEAQADRTASELGVPRSGVRELKAHTAH